MQNVGFLMTRLIFNSHNFSVFHTIHFSVPLERMVINKERAAGWYRLSAYYCAKMTSELFLILVQPAVFIIIAYWVVGLNGISAFFATLGTVFIDSIAGQVRIQQKK